VSSRHTYIGQHRHDSASQISLFGYARKNVCRKRPQTTKSFTIRFTSDCLYQRSQQFLPRDAGSAKRSIAIGSHPSVVLSVSLMYRGCGRIGWTSSKLLTQVIAYGLRTSEPQHQQSTLCLKKPDPCYIFK